MDTQLADREFIRIFVKNVERKEEFVVDRARNVRDLKPLFAERFNARTAHLRLIYAGHMLSDEDTLRDHNVQQDHIIHLVIHTGKRVIHRRPQSCVQEHMAWNSEEGAGFDGNTDLELDAQRSSYIVGSLLNNQDFISELLNADPRVESYFNTNRQLADIIHNSPLVRDYLASIANTHTMQDIIRNQEHVLRNIESIPGGLEALESICSANVALNPRCTNDSEQAAEQPAEGIEQNPFLPSPELLTRLLSNSHVLQLVENLAREPSILHTLQSLQENSMSNLGDNHSGGRRDAPQPPPPAAADTTPTMGTSPGLQDFITQMANQRPPPPILPPAVRYSNQLEQLQRMGFSDHNANLLALCRSFGNVNGAVKILTENE